MVVRKTLFTKSFDFRNFLVLSLIEVHNLQATADFSLPVPQEMTNILTVFINSSRFGSMPRFFNWVDYKDLTLFQLRKNDNFQQAIRGMFEIFETFVFTKFDNVEILREDVSLKDLNLEFSLTVRQLDGGVPVPRHIDRFEGPVLTVTWQESDGSLDRYDLIHEWKECKHWQVKFLKSTFLQPSRRADDVQLFLATNPTEPLYPEANLEQTLGGCRNLIARKYSVAEKEETIPSLELVSLIVKDKVGQCSICLEDLVQSDREVDIQIRQIKTCKHLFHVKCLSQWLSDHATCPLCRVLIC
jgi:hypothetical protein